MQTPSPKFFNGPPDIADMGFNPGANVGIAVPFSGTVGAATEAVKEGIPGIDFSGTSGSQTTWTATVETYETVYADLSTNVTQAVLKSEKPYLPGGIFLNINYPAVSVDLPCHTDCVGERCCDLRERRTDFLQRARSSAQLDATQAYASEKRR